MKSTIQSVKVRNERGKTTLFKWLKVNPKRFFWLLLLPFFLIWFAWVKSKWGKGVKLAVTVLAVIFLVLTLTTNDNKPTPAKSSPATQQQPTKTEQSTNSTQLYNVIAVIDGDTIDVDLNGKTERLRLIGLDTPETKDPRKPVQCFGKEASEQARKLLDGKQVRLEAEASQGERDKYDRLLRYVYLEDGTSYNKQIIFDGYAHEYTYNTPYKYQTEYKQAQKDAEAAQRGLWSPSTCSGNTVKVAEPAAPTQPVVTPTPTQPTDTYYANCTAARDAGAAPLHTGDAGYRSALDRDGDGIACE